MALNLGLNGGDGYSGGNGLDGRDGQNVTLFMEGTPNKLQILINQNPYEYSLREEIIFLDGKSYLGIKKVSGGNGGCKSINLFNLRWWTYFKFFLNSKGGGIGGGLRFQYIKLIRRWKGWKWRTGY
jgi:hypothetical protein